MNICVLFQYKIFRNRYRYFLWEQNFSKPIPILFSIPKFFETDTDTFFDTNFFRNRYRYFFRYQIFSKPIPILFSIPKIFETDTDTIKKNGKVSKPRSFETEMSHSASLTHLPIVGGELKQRCDHWNGGERGWDASSFNQKHFPPFYLVLWLELVFQNVLERISKICSSGSR